MDKLKFLTSLLDSDDEDEDMSCVDSSDRELLKELGINITYINNISYSQRSVIVDVIRKVHEKGGKAYFKYSSKYEYLLTELPKLNYCVSLYVAPKKKYFCLDKDEVFIIVSSKN